MFNFGGKIETKAKFTIIGDASCGKTSLKNGIDIFKQSDYQFNKRYKASTDDERKTMKFLSNINGKEEEFTIYYYDTVGQEKLTDYDENTRLDTMKGSNGYIILYDVTNKNRFKNIQKWIDEIIKVNKNVPILILGNKMDLIKNISEKEEELTKLEKLDLPLQYNAGLISVKRNEFYGKEVNMGFTFGMPQNKIFKKGMLFPFEYLLSRLNYKNINLRNYN
jgi:small GTP-binding protein